MITLQKLRVYRDRAEVLLQVKLTDEVNVSPSTRVYGVPLGELTSTERSSLHILSPQHRLLHVAWHDEIISGQSPIDQATSQSNTSLSTCKTPAISHPSEELIKVVKEQRSHLGRHSKPQSLVELQRTLQLGKILSDLEHKWSAELLSQTNSLDSDQVNSRPPEGDSNTGQTKAGTTLYLYIQSSQLTDRFTADVKSQTSGHFEVDRSSLPDALSGGWIDSSPPSLPQADSSHPPSSEVEENHHSMSSDKDDPPVVWLRLNLERSFWKPSITLFLNGERGRLTLTAQLVTQGLRDLLGELDTMKASLPIDGIDVEWWDECPAPHAKSNTHTSEGKDPILSRLTVDELVAAYQQPSFQKRDTSDPASHPSDLPLSKIRLHLNSVLMVERSLGELSREQLVIHQQQQTPQTTTPPPAKISSPSSPKDHLLGYFSVFSLLKYPPALVDGVEQALQGQLSVRLLLNDVGPFLDATSAWEVQFEGRAYQIIPQQDRGGVVSLDLGRSASLTASRISGGLEAHSLQTLPHRVAVYDVSKRVLLAEQQLPPLGNVKFNALGEHLDQRADDLQSQNPQVAETDINLVDSVENPSSLGLKSDHLGSEDADDDDAHEEDPPPPDDTHMDQT